MSVLSEHRATLTGIVDELRGARRLLFITGAGISADSGLPTYRGVGGLYNSGMTEDGIAIEEAVSGPLFRRRPEITWKYLHRMNEASRGAQFNDAHRVIAEMEAHFDEVWVLTQNVDGFHRDAGSRNVIEVHGNARELHCTRCDYRAEVTDYSALAALPTCPDCGAVIRPRVVLFEEMLPDEAVTLMERELTRSFDVVFSVGTTALFPYIMSPVVEARMDDRPTVEINPERTEVSGITRYRLPTGAAESLRAIWQLYHGKV